MECSHNCVSVTHSYTAVISIISPCNVTLNNQTTDIIISRVIIRTETIQVKCKL